MKKWWWMAFCLVFIGVSTSDLQAQTEPTEVVKTIQVEPGDTWLALSWRFGTPIAELKLLNPDINSIREPAIGGTISVPNKSERSGKLIRSTSLAPQSLSLLALQQDFNAAEFMVENGLYRPWLTPNLHYFASATEGQPKELPLGWQTLELSHLVGVPGQGMGVRGIGEFSADTNITLEAGGWGALPFDFFIFENRAVGLRGTGAFFSTGQHALTVRSGNGALWSQPWRFEDGIWQFQTINFTGAAAQIDQNAIQTERARLFEIWENALPSALWQEEFQTPILEFLNYSSGYGARRSYDNGATYQTYHEGIDFAAYGGTPVLATAPGRVVVAENLYVRGGAVIIDHGLGVFSGYYHLSEINIAAGDSILQGQLLGKVGTTGLSTGNHLHWDFLVTDTWVGADKWVEQGMGCWVLEGFGRTCSQQ